MDYDEGKIRALVVAGLKGPEAWRVELEPIDFGARLGVFYRDTGGVKRVSVATHGKTEEQIAFGLLSELMNRPEIVTDSVLSPYEGKSGRHPDTCTCSKHKAVNGAQAA